MSHSGYFHHYFKYIFHICFAIAERIIFNPWSHSDYYCKFFFILASHLQIIKQEQFKELLKMSRSLSASNARTSHAKTSHSTKSNKKKVQRVPKKVKKSDYKKEFASFKNSWIHRIINRGQNYTINGPDSLAFNRRLYEEPIQSLENIDNAADVGFTNQVLVFRQKDHVHLFLPVFLSLKVKSFQRIYLEDLSAQINCVLIVRIFTEGLSQSLKSLLQNQILLQVNLGDSILLTTYGGDGRISSQYEGDFLIFTLRQTLPVQIHDDVFLSPFEILNFVLTITLRSALIPPPFSPEPGIKYQISFNCMRNPQRIPISYVNGCRLGVYDLIERWLESYPSDSASFEEIKKKFINKMQNRVETVCEQKEVRSSKYNITPKNRAPLTPPLQFFTEKAKEENIDFFYQHTHFIIPVYKHPENAWATIFIPLIMLAVLSMSMFFQEATLMERVGAIATFVLGFISLIPSIKGQLPPSNKISLSQILVYIQALNCMFSMVHTGPVDFRKNWVWKNKIMIISFMIHILCFGIALGLLGLHKLSWELRYKTQLRSAQINPNKNRRVWNNPYCDDKFHEFNDKSQIKIEKLRELQKYNKIYE